MSEVEGNGNLLRFRVGEVERELEILRLDSKAVSRHEEQISGAGGLIKTVENLGEEVKSLRKALYAFALGLPIAGITFLLGILALVKP